MSRLQLAGVLLLLAGVIGWQILAHRHEPGGHAHAAGAEYAGGHTAHAPGMASVVLAVSGMT